MSRTCRDEFGQARLLRRAKITLDPCTTPNATLYLGLLSHLACLESSASDFPPHHIPHPLSLYYGWTFSTSCFSPTSACQSGSSPSHSSCISKKFAPREESTLTYFSPSAWWVATTGQASLYHIGTMFQVSQVPTTISQLSTSWDPASDNSVTASESMMY